MKARELREMKVEDLQSQVRDLDDQVFRLRIQKSMGQVEAPHKVKAVRRDRARVKTVLTEKSRQ